jgi:hypothetical protein
LNYYNIVSSVLLLAAFGVWNYKDLLNVIIKMGLLCLGIWGLTTWL